MHPNKTLPNHNTFGSMIENRSWSAGNGYRFGFQGQEGDDEIKGQGNSINYKFRVHDTRLGRFFSVDPVAKEFPWNSSYAFSENKVIYNIELEGMEGLWYIFKETGKVLHVESFQQAFEKNENVFLLVNGEGKVDKTSINYNSTFHGWSKEGYVASNINLWKDLPDNLDLGETPLADLKIRYAINDGNSRVLKGVLAEYDANGGSLDGYLGLNSKDFVDQYEKKFGTTSALVYGGEHYYSPDLDALGATFKASKSIRISRKIKKNIKINYKESGNTYRNAIKSYKRNKLPGNSKNNPWNDFLKENRGKYKGKDWIKQASKDYQKTKAKN